MELSAYTRALLEDLERRIDPETEDAYQAQWIRYWEGKHEEMIFRPVRKNPIAPGVELKKIHINDALEDYELMLDMQLIDASRRLASTGDAPGVRANYGTGIMTTLFGAEVFVMPREMATLPTTRSFNDTDIIHRIVDEGAPDLYRGFGKDVFHFGEMCAEIFKDYPKIQKYVPVYHPDTQGPLDVAELLWGGEMFYEMYDDPDFVHQLMRLVTDTYKRFLDHWYTIIPKREGYNVHWQWIHPGTIMLRDDSAMNLSPELYKEFAFPYDDELLTYYGGGCVHFCGRGDHYIDILTAAKDLTCFNMSQPHLNNLDVIYGAMHRTGKRILGLKADAAAEYAKRPDGKVSMIHS